MRAPFPQDAAEHDLPPTEICWTSDDVWSADGDAVKLFDKDGLIATSAVCRMRSILTLSADLAAGTITVTNSSDSDIDIASYSLHAETADEVRLAVSGCDCAALLYRYHTVTCHARRCSRFLVKRPCP
jgi:hypothetical protein